MSFLLIVAVICLLALFVLLLGAGGASRVADRAAVLAARGDTEEARGLLFAAKGSQDDPSALFVRACLELEEGRPDSASAIAVRLRSMKPEAPELLVLSKLIEERKRAPADRWTDAAAGAWKAAGRPPPGAKQLLNQIDVQRPIDPAALTRLRGTLDGFLVAFGESEHSNLVDAAMEVSKARDLPAGAQLVAVHVLLDAKVLDPSDDRRRSAGWDLLSRLSRTEPDDGYIALALVVAGTDPHAPLTDSELIRLEDALRRRTFGLPIRPLFVAFQAAYQRVDRGQAASKAFSEMTAALPLDTHLLLSRRAGVTDDPALRFRAAEVLGLAGSRLQSGPSFLERMIGLSLEARAAELRSNAAQAQAVRVKRERLNKLMEDGSAFWRYAWPIASLGRDHLERNSVEEVRYAEAMAQ